GDPHRDPTGPHPVAATQTPPARARPAVLLRLWCCSGFEAHALHLRARSWAARTRGAGQRVHGPGTTPRTPAAQAPAAPRAKAPPAPLLCRVRYGYREA